jgi:hypothetical protein
MKLSGMAEVVGAFTQQDAPATTQVNATMMSASVSMTVCSDALTGLTKSVMSVIGCAKRIICGPVRQKDNSAFMNHLFVMAMIIVMMGQMRILQCADSVQEVLDFHFRKACRPLLPAHTATLTKQFVQFRVMEKMTSA